MRLAALLYAFILMMIFAPYANSKSPPSAFDFIKPSENVGLELSPNGNLVAFAHIQTNKFCLDRYGQMKPVSETKCKARDRLYRSTYTLAVWNLISGKIESSVILPENMSIEWIEFISDERILVSLKRPPTIGHSGRGWSYGASKVLSFNLNPAEGEPASVFLFEEERRVSKQNDYLSRVANILRNEPDYVLMPAYKNADLDLWKVDVRDGSAERVGRGKKGTFYWYTDRAGKPVFRFDCRGSSCKKIDVYSFNDPKEKWEKIRTFKLKPDEGEDKFKFYPVAPTENKDQFYVITEDDGDDRRSVKIFDTKTQQFIRTVFAHPKYDVGNVITSVSTGDYQGVWYYADRLEYEFTNKKHQKHYEALNKYFKDKANVSFIGFNKTGNLATLRASSPTSAGAYYLYNYEKRQVTLIVENEPQIEVALSGDGNVLSIPTRDGNAITAYHYYPKNQQRSKLPLLVMPHGGPEARDYFGYDYRVQYFISRGYQVLRLNFRGSSGYGKAFAEAGYGQWGGLMQDDITDTVKHFYSQGLASADKTCIVGYSYGGYAALYGGASTPDLYKCVVSGGGVSDLKLSLKNSKRDHGKDSETYEYWLESQGNPKTDAEILAEKSPVNLAENFKAPVLLIHGERDGIVHVEQSEIMEKALKNAGKDVTYIELDREGHSNWSLENEMIYYEAIDAFLEKHIGQ